MPSRQILVVWYIHFQTSCSSGNFLAFYCFFYSYLNFVPPGELNMERNMMTSFPSDLALFLGKAKYGRNIQRHTQLGPFQWGCFKWPEALAAMATQGHRLWMFSVWLCQRVSWSLSLVYDVLPQCLLVNKCVCCFSMYFLFFSYSFEFKVVPKMGNSLLLVKMSPEIRVLCDDCGQV